MTESRFYLPVLLVLCILPAAVSAAGQSGGIRGMVYDTDFDVPLAAAQVSIAETGTKTIASDQGNYVFNEIAPGTYTLVFSKDGYVRQVKANVVVSAGEMTEVDASLAGDFTEMEEFVVQDVQMGTGTEAALLDLRLESPALMDSVGAELMSRAGAGDAAAALRLVAGATVQDGKYATVRGLPDRYVSSQMNGVRLPTSDTEKRAVQLDQFPAAAIESIQVSKTFTPDQQGDASGGAVNIVLKGVPDETSVKFGGSTSWNSPSAGDKFLSYKGGGVNTWGRDDGGRDDQTPQTNWKGSVGVSEESEPTDYKWAVSGGGKHLFENGWKFGAFGSFFYERDSSHYEDGIDDSYWVYRPGESLTPKFRGSPNTDGGQPLYMSLFDVTQSSQSVQWGGLGILGLETENHSLSFTNMYTRDATDTVTLAENTRGKAMLHSIWPGVYGPEFDNYDPTDPTHPANQVGFEEVAPYQRNETLDYVERTTKSHQFSGRHTLPDLELGDTNFFMFQEPELDWTFALSTATLDEPDKRLFATWWYPQFDGTEGVHRMYRDADSFNLGNLQRIWKDVKEDSDQYFVNLKFPFEQWSGDEGYVKTGIFNDKVTREYNQDSFGNNGEETQFTGAWKNLWSSQFPYETHFINESEYDVDYQAEQTISAWYYMIDMPLNSYFNVIGGARYEQTELMMTNSPDGGENTKVTYYPTDTGPVALKPGVADVDFSQKDVLPSIGFEFKPWKPVILRGSYTETVARQTFKELSPIKQQEYVGGDVFIGNNLLQMSSLDNYDLRLDWTPYESALVSVSYFHKDVTNPIEYVLKQGNGFSFTKPVNYPEGELDGYEFEVRQQLGRFWEEMDGLSVGGNVTLIDSEVLLPELESDRFNAPTVEAPMTKRDMTNAPEHLYNIFTMYDIEKTGTQLALFYTVRGDTLVTGAGVVNGSLVPNVYEKEYGTLNFSLSQKLGEIWKLTFQAKNLLDPEIETVYRNHINGQEQTKEMYQKGMEFSISLSASF